MNRVIVESPYAGDIEENIMYARSCIRQCLMRNEAPFASHLLYTQEGVLDDTLPVERELGIKAGLEWLQSADVHAFYVDYGISPGMKFALGRSIKQICETNHDIEIRSLATAPQDVQKINIPVCIPLDIEITDYQIFINNYKVVKISYSQHKKEYCIYVI